MQSKWSCVSTPEYLRAHNMEYNEIVVFVNLCEFFLYPDLSTTTALRIPQKLPF